jgi:hypothetical protein
MTPFAGALVPMRFYGKDLRVRALMIEVRRGLYMDERSGARGPAFDEDPFAGQLAPLRSAADHRPGRRKPAIRAGARTPSAFIACSASATRTAPSSPPRS